MTSEPCKVRKPTWQKMLRQKNLYIMILPAFVLTLIFAYLPTWGVLVALFDYNPGLGLFGSPFVGLKHFARFFNDSSFWMLIRNSFAISLLNIVFGTVFPIVFAILLNEVGSLKFKKTVQTISYLPHFVSYVVVANIALTVFSNKGAVNNLLMSLGITQQPIVFFTIPSAFWWLVAGVNIWKELGWSAIIYITSITGIDPGLYEAAMVDGAGRWQRIRYITLPGIKSTIFVLLILSVPGLLNAGFEPSYLLGNAMVYDYSEVLDTYTYSMGIQYGQYSYAAAIGLLQQILGLVLILGANATARKYSDYSLF